MVGSQLGKSSIVPYMRKQSQRARDMTKVVEHLPSKCKTLSSDLSSCPPKYET
jgi:hypothetical protein